MGASLKARCQIIVYTNGAGTHSQSPLHFAMLEYDLLTTVSIYFYRYLDTWLYT